MKKICVIGSMNIDWTFKVPAFHAPGETILAQALHISPGGKGGNQAVAAAKLDAPVRMVGMLGDDDNARLYQKIFQANGVDTGCIQILENMHSGMAMIEVNQQGENRIIVIPGANMEMDTCYLDSVMPKIREDDIFLFQLETPLETVCHAAGSLHSQGKLVILDPAPAVTLPDSLLKNIDYLTPNRRELETVSGQPAETDDQVCAAAKSLLTRGVGAVVAKLGARGCLYVDKKTFCRCKGFQVQTVDTTAAGDSFNAGFAVALAMGKAVPEALCFANAVGALSTTGHGAQAAMPSLEQTEAFLKRNTETLKHAVLAV